MKLWEIKTVEKKNVFQRTHFVVPSDGEIAAGKTFYMEEWYRWGRCVVRSDEAPTAAVDPYKYPLDLGDYDVDDQECDDGCYLEFSFEEDDEWTEEERAYIEDLWEEDGWCSFEEHGIQSDDCDVEYHGPLEITEVGEVDDTPPHGSDVKNAWPF